MEDTILSICVGVGLSAACGFRVFVPLLITSIAARTGHVALASQFAWVGSDPALIAFGVATAVEIAGYYIPWVDHLLDTIATPAAVVAGVIVTGSMLTHVDPFMRWTLAVIAGGGVAGAVQAGTVLMRAASTATTGGLGNPLVATAELGLSAFTSVLAIIFPIVAAFLVLVIALIIGRKVWQRFRPQVQT
jgi:hypothetical protein